MLLTHIRDEKIKHLLVATVKEGQNAAMENEGLPYSSFDRLSLPRMLIMKVDKNNVYILNTVLED